MAKESFKIRYISIQIIQQVNIEFSQLKMSKC